ncbi:FAD-dependent oxidoreductase [Rhodoferax saidenbachensis]|nr:FAD-dependent oxidoreductase [Rhodoferax saidenbachensis]
MRQQKIAIIGSGMAGLAAAWYLGDKHHVTLLERQPRIGIGAHRVDLDGGAVDVPLRVIYPGYYQALMRLFADAGIALQPLDASLSFAQWGGDSYFRYRNTRVLGRTVPWMPPTVALQPDALRILRDLGRLMVQMPLALASGTLQGTTLGDWLDGQGYSRVFVDGFLVPCFAGINTASHAAVRAYPATTIAQYFTPGFLLSPVYRAVGGATAIADALSQRIAKVQLNADIARVERTPDGVRVQHTDGHTQHFDALIFGTQANQVLPMLSDASREERTVLGGFRYDSVRILMHHDTRLAPKHQRDWAPVNYLLDPAWDRPMVSIWVNRLLPDYQSERPVFQTLNPFEEPDAATVLQDTTLQRPLVGLDTAKRLQRLDALHAQDGRCVFFCGSYAAQGIPLLESAVASARAVAGLVG